MYLISKKITPVTLLPPVSTPKTHNTPFGQDVTEVLHLEITMLGGLNSIDNMPKHVKLVF